MFKHMRQLGAESFVYGISGVISRFIGFFLMPIYTRVFAPEDYGVISLVATTMAVVSVFVVLALDSAAGRWYYDTDDLAERKNTLASWAWCQLGASLALAAAIFAFSGPLAQAITGSAGADRYFRLAALTLPLTVLGSILTNWLRFQRRPWVTIAYTIASSLATILLSILFVVSLRWGLTGVYSAQLLSGLLGTLVAAFLLRDWIRPRHFRWRRLKEMLRFSLPLVPAALAYWVVSFSGRFYVQAYGNASEVGLYQVGVSLAAIVAIATGAFQQAWGPFSMSIHKRADAKQVYASVFLVYIWLACALSTAIALFAPELVRLLATARYLGASSVVGILAFSYVMIGLTYIANVGPTIAKVTAPAGLALTAAALLNILLNLLLTPRLGKVGSAIATLVSQALVPAFLFYRSRSIYPIPYRFAPAVGILGLSAGLILLGNRLEVSWMSAALKLGLLVLFLPALPLSGIISPEQVQRLLRQFVKR